MQLARDRFIEGNGSGQDPGGNVVAAWLVPSAVDQDWYRAMGQDLARLTADDNS